MKTERIKFTQKTIEAIPLPESGQKTYYDTETNDGLCLVVSYGGAKTYFLQMYFRGRGIKAKIGSANIMKLAEAKIKAHSLRELAEQGIDPCKKRRDELDDMTLKQFYLNQYKARYSLQYKRPKTIQKDDSMFNNYLVGFHSRKMMSITQTELERLHKDLKDRISLYTANRTITLIKHMYNMAHEWGYPKEYENPASNIKMFPEKSRDRFLDTEELQRFFEELQREPNIKFRNFILLSLFIGQRRENMLAIRWEDIDMVNGFVFFSDTKNGESQRIPLTKHSIDILLEMRKESKKGFLFPSSSSKSGHVEDFHRPWYALLKRAHINNFRFHDVRRTFGSYQAISGSSLQVIGKSLGHKSSMATAVYARLTADPIRESMERGIDKMLGVVADNK